MTGLRRLLVAALLVAALALAAGAAMAQPSFDCGRASSAAEKAICADPGLAAADAAMAKAFAALLKALPPTQQTVLKIDQGHWITGRDGVCFDKKDGALTR